MQRVILSDLSPSARRRIVRRSAVVDPKVRAGAAVICEEVRTGGDAALVAASDRFGGGRPAGMAVTRAEMDAALAFIPADERLAQRPHLSINHGLIRAHLVVSERVVEASVPSAVRPLAGSTHRTEDS